MHNAFAGKTCLSLVIIPIDLEIFDSNCLMWISKFFINRDTQIFDRLIDWNYGSIKNQVYVRWGTGSLGWYHQN